VYLDVDGREVRKGGHSLLAHKLDLSWSKAIRPEPVAVLAALPDIEDLEASV
jgi:hypothetical protein